MNQDFKKKISLDGLLNDGPLDKPYLAVTNNIEVAVWPEFIDGKSGLVGELYVWSYLVRIENKTKHSVKLVSRYWKIIDEGGSVQEVTGEGVIGEQPTILPQESYQYTSGVHLKRPSGVMMGKYFMEDSSGNKFEVTIPSFSLDVPSQKNTIN